MSETASADLADEDSEEGLIALAQEQFERCAEWESTARPRMLDDFKFAEADSDNGYQWPDQLRRSRDQDQRPCLTMNVTRQHILQVLNPRRQQKLEVNIVGTGNGATADSAKVFRAILRDIQYSSQARSAYEVGGAFQVKMGKGYWRLVTDYVDEGMEQEIFVLPILDPFSVYLDPKIKQKNGSDAKFGFVFDSVPLRDFKHEYPQYAHVAGLSPLGLGTGDSDWIGKDQVRVCEWFRKVLKKDRILSFVDADGRRRTARESGLPKEIVKELLKHDLISHRDIWSHEVQWKLIVGEKIIDETIWPGSHIPLIRCVGEETVIDGVYDCKGHTRAMKDAQRMFNYNSSGQVEFVALQTKSPWTGASAAIQEHETMWNNANTENFSFLPFEHLDDDGNPIPQWALPRRVDPPSAAPAFEAGMTTAFNQIMMTSGQWQNQMGMMGNERTGEAIQQRQEQGDISTAHFQDNYEDSLVFTGIQIIELIPKIYDTRRVKRLQADDGTDLEIEIDPTARLAYFEQLNHQNQVVRRVFNPQVGRYDVRAVPGQSGTRREQTVKALTLILTQAPALTGIIGDLLLSAMDFEEAQEAAQRLKRMVPPQALGKGPTPNEQQLQLKVHQLQLALSEALQKVGKTQLKLAGKDQMRDIDAYKAETDRFKALGEALGLDPAGLKEVVEQLVREAGETHLTPILEANAGGVEEQSGGSGRTAGEAPPVPGAQRAPDGEWYLTDPTRRGRYLKVAPLAQERDPRSVIANA